MKNTSVRAGIVPHLTNHCIRATLVTVLSEANYPSRYIMGVTGHKSETSLESYNKSATFKQKEAISDDLSQFIDKENVQPAVSTRQNNAERSTVSTAMLAPVRVGNKFNPNSQLLQIRSHPAINPGQNHNCFFPANNVSSVFLPSWNMLPRFVNTAQERSIKYPEAYHPNYDSHSSVPGYSFSNCTVNIVHDHYKN